MLNMTRPPSTPTPALANGKKILIWAGSSTIGSLAVSHAKHAGYTVITTCSAHNFPLLKSLGADHVFDRNVKETVQKIKDLGDIEYFFDPVSKVDSLHMIVQILSDSDGKPIKKAAIVTTMPERMIPGLTLPEGITTKFLLFRNKAEENKEFVEWYSRKGGYLESGLKGGWIKGVPDDVIGGLDKVSEGVDMLGKGVSGRRIIIEAWRE
jgi:hypothetical protein